MSKAVLRAAAAILISLPATGAIAHSPLAAPESVRLGALPLGARQAARAVDAFHAALARGDSVAAAALLDTSAVIYEQGQAELSKAEYVASHLPADIAFLAIARETVGTRTGGANAGLAWIATQGHVEGHLGDRFVVRDTTESMILRKTSLGWRIVHVHWSSHTPSAHGG